LFFTGGDQKMMAAEVKAQAGFEHRTPVALFDTRIPDFIRYDVDADGRRFLMIGSQEQPVTASMTVAINWQAGLRWACGKTSLRLNFLECVHSSSQSRPSASCWPKRPHIPESQ
jgi:hypothetical protein